jgi:hypothetical protein
MGLIKKRVHEEKEPINLRLPVSVVRMLNEHAKFIEDSKEYIITEALKHVWLRDPDFQAHLQAKQLADSPAEKPKASTRKPAPPAEVTPLPIPQTKGI